MATITRDTSQDTSQSSRDGISHMLRFTVILMGVFLAAGGGTLIGATDAGMLVFVGVLGLFVTVSIIIRPHIGMYVLLAFIYLNISAVLEDRFGIPDLNKFVVALIAISVIGTRLILLRKRIIFRSTEMLMLLYIFVVFISLFIGSGINSYTFLEAINVGKDFILILIIVQLATEEVPWKKAQWMLVIMAGLLSILTVYQTATGDYANDFFGLATSRTDSVAGDVQEYIDIWRVGGPVGDPNFYAQILLMVFPIAMYRALDNRNMSAFGRFLAFAFMGLIGIAIVLTYSRGALLVLLAICALIIIERRMNPIKVGMIMVVIFTVLLPVMPEGYTERVLSLFGGDDEESSTTDVSVQGRASEMIIATQMFEDYPVFGIGYALYEENYQTYNVKLGMDPRIELRQAHSLYLESLAETGVTGFITMMAMYIVVLWGVWRARIQAIEIGRRDLVPWVSGLGLGLLAYLMSSFFLHDDYVRYLRISLALAASASVMVSTLAAEYEALEKEKPKNNKPKNVASFVTRKV